MANLEKLNSIVSKQPSRWQKDAQWRKENRAWLKKSAEIAVRVILELKEKKMSQKDLAERMGVSPQYINKMVKGKEKLSLETICKIESALNIKLISIIPFEETAPYTVTHKKYSYEQSAFTARVKGEKLDYSDSATYTASPEPSAA